MLRKQQSIKILCNVLLLIALSLSGSSKRKKILIWFLHIKCTIDNLLDKNQLIYHQSYNQIRTVFNFSLNVLRSYIYIQVNNYNITYKMMDYNTTMRHNKIYIYLSHSQKNINLTPTFIEQSSDRPGLYNRFICKILGTC